VAAVLRIRRFLPSGRELVAETIGTVLGGIVLALGGGVIGLLDLSAEQVVALIVAFVAVATAAGVGAIVTRGIRGRKRRDAEDLANTLSDVLADDDEASAAWSASRDSAKWNNLSAETRKRYELAMYRTWREARERFERPG
jgi:hypothetical protein